MKGRSEDVDGPMAVELDLEMKDGRWMMKDQQWLTVEARRREIKGEVSEYLTVPYSSPRGRAGERHKGACVGV